MNYVDSGKHDLFNFNYLSLSHLSCYGHCGSHHERIKYQEYRNGGKWKQTDIMDT